MQGQEITYPVRLLEFEVNQLVLGEDWLKQCGALLNYKDMSLEIEHKRRTMLFSVVPRECKMITTASLFKMCMATNPREGGRFFAISVASKEKEAPHELHDIQSSFEEVFTEPQGLPPMRDIDHQIVLKMGSEPKDQSPYKYSHSAKGEIKRIVEDLLKT